MGVLSRIWPREIQYGLMQIAISFGVLPKSDAQGFETLQNRDGQNKRRKVYMVFNITIFTSYSNMTAM